MLILQPITKITANDEKDLVTAFFNAMSLMVFQYLYNRDEQKEIGLPIRERAKLLVSNLVLAKPLLKRAYIASRDWSVLISSYTSQKYLDIKYKKHFDAIENIAFDI